MAPHGKELSEDLKRHIVALREDDQGYYNIANTLKLSGSAVAKVWMTLATAFYKCGVHSEQASGGSSKEAERTCWALHPNTFFERSA